MDKPQEDHLWDGLGHTSPLETCRCQQPCDHTAGLPCPRHPREPEFTENELDRGLDERGEADWAHVQEDDEGR